MLALLVTGASAKDIARDLGLRTGYVHNVINEIRRKLDCRSAVEVCALWHGVTPYSHRGGNGEVVGDHGA